jgi:hypothetical protein
MFSGPKGKGGVSSSPQTFVLPPCFLMFGLQKTEKTALMLFASVA